MKKKTCQLRTYQIRYHCSNCGDSGTIEVPQGQTVDATRCPHCGCRTLSRNQKDYYYDGDWKRWFPQYWEHDKGYDNKPWWYPPTPMC